LINRINTYPITKRAEKEEMSTIKTLKTTNTAKLKHKTPKTKTQRKYRYTTTKEKISNIHIQQNRNKENNKTL
jgi:hypothetical protein